MALLYTFAVTTSIAFARREFLGTLAGRWGLRASPQPPARSFSPSGPRLLAARWRRRLVPTSCGLPPPSSHSPPSAPRSAAAGCSAACADFKQSTSSIQCAAATAWQTGLSGEKKKEVFSPPEGGGFFFFSFFFLPAVTVLGFRLRFSGRLRAFRTRAALAFVAPCRKTQHNHSRQKPPAAARLFFLTLRA